MVKGQGSLQCMYVNNHHDVATKSYQRGDSNGKLAWSDNDSYTFTAIFIEIFIWTNLNQKEDFHITLQGSNNGIGVKNLKDGEVLREVRYKNNIIYFLVLLILFLFSVRMIPTIRSQLDIFKTKQIVNGSHCHLNHQ